jgi:hypothetical protein
MGAAEGFFRNLNDFCPILAFGGIYIMFVAGCAAGVPNPTLRTPGDAHPSVLPPRGVFFPG